MTKTTPAARFTEMMSNRTHNVKRARGDAAAVKAAKPDMIRALKDMAHVAGDFAMYCWESVSYDGEVNLYVEITESKATQLLSPAFKRATFRALALDFKMADELQKNASEYYASGTAEGKKIYGLVNVALSLRAELDTENEGATCRRVQVGVEVKEVPKYEIVCG